jgi:uncharacterized membrane protein YfcA
MLGVLVCTIKILLALVVALVGVLLVVAMVCYISSKWRFFSENAHRRVRILLFWIPIISLFIAIIIIIHINQSLLQDAFKLGLILLAFHVFFYSVLIFNSALAKKANILRLTKGEMRRCVW